MKRSDFIQAVSTLLQDLRRPPTVAEVGGQLARAMGTSISVGLVTSGLKMLEAEGKVMRRGDGWGLATVDRRKQTIGPTPKLVQTPTVDAPAPAVDDEDPFATPKAVEPEEPAGDRGFPVKTVDEALGPGFRRVTGEQEHPKEIHTSTIAAPEFAPIDQTMTISAETPKLGHRVTVGRWQIILIRVVMAAAGLGAAGLSAYFAALRLESFVPAALAWILGIIMVLFSLLAFETVIVFMRRHRAAIAVLFVVLWVIVWFFTLLASVSGFYGYFTKVTQAEHASSAGQDALHRQLDLIHQRQTDLSLQIDQRRQQIKDLQALISQTTSDLQTRNENAQVYLDAQARLVSREEALTKLQDDLEASRQQEAKLIADQPVAIVTKQRADFFTWVGGLIHISADSIELTTSLLPSAFIDIISAAGCAIALFL